MDALLEKSLEHALTRLSACESRCHRILEESIFGFLFLDPDGTVLFANQAAASVLGVRREDLPGETFQELVDGSLEGKVSLPGLDGKTVDLRFGVIPSEWNGTPAFFVMLQDLTEQMQLVRDREQAVRELTESEARFRWLFDSNLIAIFYWDTKGRITEANQAFCDLLGYTREECRAEILTWDEVTAPVSRGRDRQARQEIAEKGYCPPYEKLFISPKTGQTIPALIMGGMLSGSQTEGVAYAIDLTELKRAEEALRKSERTLKLALEATALGTFEFHPDSGEIRWSDLAKMHYGIPLDGAGSFELFISRVHPEDRDRVSYLVERALKPEGDGSFTAVYRILVEGEERNISARGRRYVDEPGGMVRLVGTCQDVTDLVRGERYLQEETAQRLKAMEELSRQERLLIDQSRLAAMGEMLGNISHQWRQPLNTLALLIQELPLFYEQGLFSKGLLDKSVSRARQVIHHMSQTIDGFRTFIRPGGEVTPFRAADVVVRTASLVESAFQELRGKLEVTTDPEVVIEGCPNEYSQVVLNILANARDALVERRVAQPRIVIRLFQEQGRGVLTIADNAGGIASDLLGRVFDPYFTTKGPEKGTGIGLFMSKTIIEKHMNGTLSARNVGEGAEFRIEIEMVRG